MKVHFFGLGGAGLSALAGWMSDHGYEVSGCDLSLNSRIKPLIEKGVEFSQGNSVDHITDDLDWLVYPNIDPSLAEIKQAKEKGLTSLTYFQALGKVTADYQTIAVSGAHGKTTTTLMVKTILEKLGKEPNAIVGEGIYCHGQSELFVVEACEYKQQFLALSPNILIITNIAYDHPDCYQSIDQVTEAFKKLAAKMPKDGWVIGYGKDKRVNEVLAEAEKRGLNIETYGEELVEFEVDNWGSTSKLNFDDAQIKLHLDLPGKHNVLNAIAAIKAVNKIGVNPQQAADSLSGFTGCRRRMEKIGEIGQAVLVDDYGHHPDQIASVLSSVKDVYPDNRIVAVFEPHQFERTWQLFDKFTRVWGKADKVYLLPIYKVKGRESAAALENVNIKKLYQGIKKNKPEVELISGYEELIGKLEKEGDKSKAIVILSAGPVSDFLRQKV